MQKNEEHIIDITADCDCDALVIRVNKEGPACHTGAESCFHNPLFVSQENTAFSLPALMELLQARTETPWYGQLMTVPQTIAYFLQVNHWLERYRIRLG